MLKNQRERKLGGRVATLLRALKYPSPNNVFIFHDDETGKSLNFLLPMKHRKSRNESLEQKADPQALFSETAQAHGKIL